MDDVHIKIEPDIGNEDSFNGGQGNEHQLQLQPYIDPQINPSQYHGMTWKHVGHLPIAEQVEVMETAVKHGVAFLRKGSSILEAAKEEIPSAVDKQTKLDHVFSGRKTCRVEVVFVGQTGAGKSSVIK